MLKNINNLLTGELLKELYEMGHGDLLAIVDANYPAHAMNKKVISYPNTSATEILNAIIKYIPIDHIDKTPILIMDLEGKDKKSRVNPKIWDEFNSIIKNENEDYPECYKISRQDFYDMSKKSNFIIQTSEKRIYGDIIIRKGVIKED